MSDKQNNIHPAEIAEEELMKLVKSGHAASIKFFLETKGKHLGYEKKSETDDELNSRKLSPEEMAERFDALLGLPPHKKTQKKAQKSAIKKPPRKRATRKKRSETARKER